MRLQDNLVVLTDDNPFKFLGPTGFHWIIEKIEEDRYSIRGHTFGSYKYFMNNMNSINQQVVAQQTAPFRNDFLLWNIVQSSDPNYVSIISPRNNSWLDGRNH